MRVGSSLDADVSYLHLGLNIPRGKAVSYTHLDVYKRQEPNCQAVAKDGTCDKGHLMPNPLFDALFAPLQRRDTAFLILADGRQISGKTFFSLIARLANALRAAGAVSYTHLDVYKRQHPAVADR